MRATDDEDTTGGATAGCAMVDVDDEACARTMILDFVLAAAEDGGGDTMMGCKAGFEGEETVAFLAFCFAAVRASAASLALILIGALQVKHIFRRDMVPFLIFALRLWS